MRHDDYDKQLRAMLAILKNDYAGLALGGKGVDGWYYMQVASMAWTEGKLDDLLFFRYGSQMLASTMDRSLRLVLTAEDYTPWRAGFDARRYGDALIVTAVQEEKRLRPGDKILLLNGHSPEEHRMRLQKNILYAEEAEREMWGNLLKMATQVLVEHADGTSEDMPLARYTGPRPACPPQTRRLESDTVYLNVGDVGDGEALRVQVEQNRALLDGAQRLVIDLRGTHDGEESAFLPLVPYVLREPKTMSEAMGVQALCTLYTEANCRRRLEILTPYAGNPAADELIAELENRRGAGWVEETADLWADMPQAIAPRGRQTVLLTDTYTEGAAETFALLAKKEGRARLVGRATMGNLDYANIITVALSERIAFSYPMTITREAKDGNGFKGRGVQPDVALPFAPEECVRDAVLARGCAADLFA